jgi:hypothetical protein
LHQLKLCQKRWSFSNSLLSRQAGILGIYTVRVFLPRLFSSNAQQQRRSKKAAASVKSENSIQWKIAMSRFFLSFSVAAKTASVWHNLRAWYFVRPKSGGGSSKRCNKQQS